MAEYVGVRHEIKRIESARERVSEFVCVLEREFMC